MIGGVGPLTLVHGDASSLNMRTGPDGEVALLDWEDVSAAPGVVDLAWLLVSSAEPAQWDEAIAAYGTGETLAQVLPATAVQGLLSLSGSPAGSEQASAWMAALTRSPPGYRPPRRPHAPLARWISPSVAADPMPTAVAFHWHSCDMKGRGTRRSQGGRRRVCPGLPKRVVIGVGRFDLANCRLVRFTVRAECQDVKDCRLRVLVIRTYGSFRTPAQYGKGS